MLKLTAESDDDELGSIVVAGLARGSGRRGGTVEGKVFGGQLKVAIDLDRPNGDVGESGQLGAIHFDLPDVVGRDVMSAYREVRFMADCHRATTIAIRTITGVSFGRAELRTPSSIATDDRDLLVDALDALATIGQYSPQPLKVPPLDTGAIVDYGKAARLLCGERVVQDEHGRFQLDSLPPPEALQPPPGVAMLVEVDMALNVSEQHVPIGRVRITFVDPVVSIEDRAKENWLVVNSRTGVVITELISTVPKLRPRP